MKIQVNTDENVEGGEDLSARVSAEIHTHLDRFSEQITRIEVHQVRLPQQALPY